MEVEISDKLVQRVNELYYSLVKDDFNHIMRDRFTHEKRYWEDLSKQFIDFSKQIKLIDIGTGTGFVPLTLGNFLQAGSLFVCSDISEDVLKLAKSSIDQKQFHCDFKYMKIPNKSPYVLPFETDSFDVVTINEVLHHVNNVEVFISEVNRILKPGGLLFIGNEPNNYFNRNRFLWYNYRLLYFILTPKMMLIKIIRIMRLEKIAKKILLLISPKNSQRKNEVIDRINAQLIQDNLIKEPLTPQRINQIVEIRWGEKSDLKPDKLLEGYDILTLLTYSHLGYWYRYYDSSILRTYDNFLKRVFPRDGAMFFIVFKKNR